MCPPARVPRWLSEAAGLLYLSRGPQFLCTSSYTCSPKLTPAWGGWGGREEELMKLLLNQSEQPLPQVSFQEAQVPGQGGEAEHWRGQPRHRTFDGCASLPQARTLLT